MNLKTMKETLIGSVKVFEGKKVFYMNPIDLLDYLSNDDKSLIEGWNGICIYPSKNGETNKCFYFYWGFGGNPDYVHKINIRRKNFD